MSTLIISSEKLNKISLENEAMTIYNMKKITKSLTDGTFTGESFGNTYTYTISSNTCVLTYSNGTTVSYTDPNPNADLVPYLKDTDIGTLTPNTNITITKL